MKNPIKFLLDEAHRNPGWIMMRTGCSAQSVANWYKGEPIARYYRAVIDRLVEKEQTRLANAVLKDANHDRS